MASAAIKSSVAGLLVIVFCTAGIVKITDKIAPEIHKQMVSESTITNCVVVVLTNTVRRLIV